MDTTTILSNMYPRSIHFLYIYIFLKYSRICLRCFVDMSLLWFDTEGHWEHYVFKTIFYIYFLTFLFIDYIYFFKI